MKILQTEVFQFQQLTPRFHHLETLGQRRALRAAKPIAKARLALIWEPLALCRPIQRAGLPRFRSPQALTRPFRSFNPRVNIWSSTPHLAAASDDVLRQHKRVEGKLLRNSYWLTLCSDYFTVVHLFIGGYKSLFSDTQNIKLV